MSRLEKAKSGDEPFSATTASNGASTGASNSNSSPGSSSSSIGGGGGSSSAGISSSSVGSGGGNTATNAATAAPASPGAAGGGSAGGVSAADLDSLSVRDLRTMVKVIGGSCFITVSMRVFMLLLSRHSRAIFWLKNMCNFALLYLRLSGVCVDSKT